MITFARLKAASFTHSAIYAALLTVWLIPGLHPEEMILGFAHGIGWILISLACLAAVRRRVLPLRVAVAVVVLGGIGPFFGSVAFVREGRRGRPRPAPAAALPGR